jgi:hypothetical protein
LYKFRRAEDSNTTDYTYAFDENQVWINSFGHGWYPASGPEPDEESDYSKNPRQTVFPLYGGRQQKVDLGERSGVMIISAQPAKSPKVAKTSPTAKRPKAE